jgi:Cdc6-like AAA superfamily ATPase
MSNSQELYNISVKFLSKSLDKLKQNKPVNLALVNEINSKFLLMSPSNIPVLPSYLLASNANAVIPINAKEAAQLTEIFYELITKIKEQIVDSNLPVRKD